MCRAVLLLSLSAGCGPGEDTPLVDLDAKLLAELCEELGAPQRYECAKDGVSIEFTVGEDCEGDYGSLPVDCLATVRDARLCEREQRAAYTENPCRTDTPESCEIVVDCQLDVD
jgi:hypothetical protein